MTKRRQARHHIPRNSCFGIIDIVLSYYENSFPLKLVVGGVAGVAYFITGHKQTHLHKVCYFHFFAIFLASKGS